VKGLRIVAFFTKEECGMCIRFTQYLYDSMYVNGTLEDQRS
jgi:hypothetical protein